MKRGKLHFLVRKNQSLFDSNIPIKEMESVELVLKSPAIPESGTASVRARPTVKHNASSFESFQGIAVATPKIPLLPPVNNLKTNGSVGGDNFSNGSVMSVPDLKEGGLFVPPPPPAMAPPPPPGAFIAPPLDFMGDFKSLNAVTLSSLSMTDPKPASLAPLMEAEDLTFMKPPPMAPPEPPPTRSDGFASTVPISSLPSNVLTQRPTFSPPAPPSESQHKSQKKPPLKPIRLSSMSNLDSPPATPAPPPPEKKTTRSTFNPQNTAKPFYVPQTSILSGYEEQDARSKQILLLEDSASSNSASVLVQVDGKAKVAPPYKPAPKDVQKLKENVPITQPSESPPPEPTKEAKEGIVSVQPKFDKPLRNPNQTSPQLRKLNGTQVNSEPIKDRFVKSPSQSRKFSPILDRKLRNLKVGETHGARDGPAASPLALLMAAKERDKHKWAPPVSQENRSKTIEQPSDSIQPSDTGPNSFGVTPKSSLSTSLTSLDRVEESLKSVRPVVHTQTVQASIKSSSAAPVKDPISSAGSALSRTVASPSVMQSHSMSQHTPPEEIIMPLLPPPPEFDDFEDPPPSIPPPDPPRKKAPTATEVPHPPSHVPPPPPRPKIPEAQKLPSPETDVKPKQQTLMKPKTQLPSTISPNQATLLSILQKKMMEMDPKMSPANEAESFSDDWGAPMSEEDNKVPVVHRTAPQSKNYPVVNKAATLNMQELERKVAKKYEETSSGNVPNGNETQSKHQYGMTFTVRPGTQQPITLVRKGDP